MIRCRGETPRPAKIIVLELSSTKHGVAVLAGRASSTEAHIADKHAMPARAKQGRVVLFFLFPFSRLALSLSLARGPGPYPFGGWPETNS